MQVTRARNVPTPPNRLCNVGMICAREKKKEFNVDSTTLTRYKIPMTNNTARKTPSIATLIRDGYLLEHEAGDPNYVTRAKMGWQDDYDAYLLDEINNEMSDW